MPCRDTQLQMGKNTDLSKTYANLVGLRVNVILFHFCFTSNYVAWRNTKKLWTAIDVIST